MQYHFVQQYDCLRRGCKKELSRWSFDHARSFVPTTATDPPNKTEVVNPICIPTICNKSDYSPATPQKKWTFTMSHWKGKGLLNERTINKNAPINFYRFQSFEPINDFDQLTLVSYSDATNPTAMHYNPKIWVRHIGYGISGAFTDISAVLGKHTALAYFDRQAVWPKLVFLLNHQKHNTIKQEWSLKGFQWYILLLNYSLYFATSRPLSQDISAMKSNDTAYLYAIWTRLLYSIYGVCIRSYEYLQWD